MRVDTDTDTAEIACCRKANCGIAEGGIANCSILWTTVKIAVAELRTSCNGPQ